MGTLASIPAKLTGDFSGLWHSSEQWRSGFRSGRSIPTTLELFQAHFIAPASPTCVLNMLLDSIAAEALVKRSRSEPAGHGVASVGPCLTDQHQSNVSLAANAGIMGNEKRSAV
jgi:hypothetical protein